MRSAMVWIGAMLGLSFMAACGSEAASFARTEQAIVNGVPAPDAVLNVGTIAFKTSPTDAVWSWWGCSGTLVSPTVFITAGHCMFGWEGSGATNFGVTFGPQMDLSEDGWTVTVPATAQVYSGTPVIHPGFDINAFGDYHVETNPDMALIVLDEAVSGVPPARIPPVGFLDGWASPPAEIEMGVAGYGLTSAAPYFKKHPVPDWGTRRFSATELVGVFPGRIEVSPDPGGGCFMDSGGPSFPVSGEAGDPIPAPSFVTTVVALVQSPAEDAGKRKHLCDGGTVSVRLDTALAHEFLDQYVP
ncbi:MAG TPA: trypsin-like serine protease [Anaeromyxobacteraceae bacterium]|nr:trypsin-like serine protease [Anaeromyxobacteraceae bacterium]